MSFFGSIEFLLEVAKGNIPGHSIMRKFGRNPSLGAEWEGVWHGSTSFNFLTAPARVRIKTGGNEADNATGIGAQKITVIGLDENGIEASEDIITAGASASRRTATTFWRVFRTYVSEAGVYGGTNAGTITIENAGTVLIHIAAGEGQSQYTAYSIAANKTGYFLGYLAHASVHGAADFRVLTRANFNAVSTPFSPARIRFYVEAITGQADGRTRSAFMPLPPWTDVYFEARSSNGEATAVSANFEIMLVDS